ncbi:hypothetical protein J4558_21100 [Leptolyngbya sp. 15MV]|nr:hypothetical protein J4558_21100 [Leptolyngbya sp. 15MV]
MGYIAVAAMAFAVPAAVAVAWRAVDDELVLILLRDQAATADHSPFTGLVSNLGAFMWLACAAVTGFTAVAWREQLGRERTLFLAAACVLSTLLLLDDFFMLHEEVLRFSIGVPEKLTLAAGALLAGGHLFRFRHEYLAERPWLIASALALLGASVMTDLALPEQDLGKAAMLFVEDGLKWFGIVAWGAWHVTYCYDAIKRAGTRA